MRCILACKKESKKHLWLVDKVSNAKAGSSLSKQRLVVLTDADIEVDKQNDKFFYVNIGCLKRKDKIIDGPLDERALLLAEAESCQNHGFIYPDNEEDMGYYDDSWHLVLNKLTKIDASLENAKETGLPVFMLHMQSIAEMSNGADSKESLGKLYDPSFRSDPMKKDKHSLDGFKQYGKIAELLGLSIKEWQKLPLSSLTRKQVNAIDMCCKAGAPKFTGSTMGEASAYLGAYLLKAKVKLICMGKLGPGNTIAAAADMLHISFEQAKQLYHEPFEQDAESEQQ